MAAAILFGLGLGAGNVLTFRQRMADTPPTSSQDMASQEQAKVPLEILPSGANPSVAPGSQGPSAHQEPQPFVLRGPAGPPEETQKVVLVRPGDSLAKILLREYGRFDAVILARITAANPDISDPAYIKIGQNIVLPRLSE